MRIEAIVSASRIVASAYSTTLTVKPSSNTTTIAQLSLQNTNYERRGDFIRKLVELYNRYTNDNKNEVVTKTAEFIDERIKIINSELGKTEQELETFKRDAGLKRILQPESNLSCLSMQVSFYQKLCAKLIHSYLFIILVS